MPARLDVRDHDFEDAFAAVLDARREPSEDVDATVAAILDDVRVRGDAAVIEYTQRFDDPATDAGRLLVSKAEIAAAWAECAPATLAALDLAAARIRAFHERQRPADLDVTDTDGVRLGWRWTAIEAVGLYVPGGTAAYPSSVLMNALPARVAGCRRLVMTVPAPGGQIAPLVLAAARIAQVDEVWRIGGAQAIGALAYGTRRIAPVDKIVGPGNAYVAAAKRRVFGRVGIDMVAGPSEVLIVADAANDPAWIAVDLLAQAEHDAAAQSILITDDPGFADVVAGAVETQLRTLPRQAIAAASWQMNGCIVVVERLDQAPALIDRIAPEHLQLAIDDADRFLPLIRNAGSIFLGRFTPEALGDYVAGPNHVLPTARSARFSSGLGVLDFMKRSTFLGCDAGGLARLGPPAVTLAEAEGLRAHARSVSIRLNAREAE
ncbi:MAG TPA: histidinol dehydrogenase [Rhodospirillales bacterium]|nr:histidinol dehydrogenase [Rhodospirillales bacterium]